MGRFVAVSLLVTGLAAGPGAGRSLAVDPCRPRVLVLSAFPAELDAVLARAHQRARRPIVSGDHTFYSGRLGRHDVVMAMTGIGPVNARNTTDAALDHFFCGTATTITAVVFSGVAGSPHRIGDVTVPRRWSDDDGATWLGVDPAMFAAATSVAAAPPPLLQDNPLPDPLCACTRPSALRSVHFPYAPQVFPGGDGITTDPFGGRAFPCIPSGGDVFGCRACHGRPGAPPDVVAFLTGILPFADGQFITDYLTAPASSVDAAASDNETAAVGRVATANGLPFIGFRGVSDGSGDPLMLPGFPVQFFTYYPLAAANAATVTAAFLQRW